MMLLDDIKIVLGIELDTSRDYLLNIYIRTATTLISKYLKANDKVDIQALYPDAIIAYVVMAMAKRGNEGLKQFSQGSRSGSYGDDLPDGVKALLPLPRIAMR
ncbi:phage head-tail connector protein [Desulfosporosinus metallidurans]|nr:phage head-tail connector protein [Desulfosporosinus metallidurans]